MGNTVPRILATDADPFTDASSFASDTSTFVKEQIEAIEATKDQTLILANSAISALSDLSDIIATLPDYDVSDPITSNISVDFTVDDIPYKDEFGAIDPIALPPDVDVTGLPTIGTVTIPGFEPSIVALDIPPAPDPTVIPLPDDPPKAPDLVFPDEIVITLPDQPELAPITIPTVTTPTLPDFDPDFPVLIERTIQTFIDWKEPAYTEEVIDEVKAQLSTFFAGGSGIDIDIEESLFARGRDREDRTVRQQEQQATEEWASKGYTAPPGMLVKRLDNIREEGLLKKLGLNREMVIKVHDDELQNLRFAVQQGIAAEQLYVQMFLSKVERLFEVQKLSVQWQIDLYKIAIQSFLAKMEEVKIRTQVYETQVRAAFLEIEIFKALIEGEKIKAETNRLLIDMYKAEIEAREATVRMYSEQVKAVGIRADIFDSQIKAYASEVQAYAARVAADKNRYDAYAARIRGEVAKADIVEAEARAYSAEVQGIETGVRAEVAALQGEVSALEVEIRNYEAAVRGLIGKSQVQANQIQANVAGYSANIQRLVAQTGAEEAASRVELASQEGTNRVNLEIFRADVVAFQARLERAVKEIELLSSTQTAAGNLASTIAAGAMAAMHVGANIQGSGGVTARGSSSYSGQSSEQVSCSTTRTTNVRYEAENLGETVDACPSFEGDNTSAAYPPT